MEVLADAVDEVIGQSLEFTDDEETVLFDRGFVRRASFLTELFETLLWGESGKKVTILM